MTASTWVMGDLHLGHDLAAKLRGFASVEQHDEAIIEIMNNFIKRRDNVWILGDVAMKRDSLHLIKQLHGINKKLVLGNHDNFRATEYMQYFVNLYGIVRYKEMIFSHAPIHPNELVYRKWRCNVHGHIHSPEKNLEKPMYVNVNIDNTGLLPTNLEDLKEIRDSAFAKLPYKT